MTPGQPKPPMQPLNESDVIRRFIGYSELNTNDIRTVPQLIDAAGFALDNANASDITGITVFKAHDDVWYVGTVEFVVALANPEFVVDTLTGDGYCECQNCGHLEVAEDLGEIEDISARVAEGEPMPAGECTKCGALSHEVSRGRALQIAYGDPEGAPSTDAVVELAESIDHTQICQALGELMVGGTPYVEEALDVYRGASSWGRVRFLALKWRAEAVSQEMFWVALVHDTVYKLAQREIENA